MKKEEEDVLSEGIDDDTGARKERGVEEGEVDGTTKIIVKLGKESVGEVVGVIEAVGRLEAQERKIRRVSIPGEPSKQIVRYARCVSHSPLGALGTRRHRQC